MALGDRKAMTDRSAGRHERARRTLVGLFVALAVVLAVPALSWGHPGPAPDALPEATGAGNLPSSLPVTDGFWPSPLGVALALVLALGLPWFIRPRRRAAILALTIVLLVFAFETSLHSVHHLVDREKAAKCQVFGVSHHLSGTPTDGVNIETLLLTVAGPPPTHAEPGLSTRFLRPDQGRAPPSLAAA